MSEKERLQTALLAALHAKDPNLHVHVQQSSAGWMRLRVISSVFVGQGPEAREALVNDALLSLDLELGRYPLLDHVLLSPGEPIPAPIEEPPLWSQVLQTPEPVESAAIAAQPAGTIVVTFYSFKGGVGRSTALAVTARLLAEVGRRVIMVDFDLEAPGLTVMLPPPRGEQPRPGVLDYVAQRWLTPEAPAPAIQDFIQPVSISDDAGRSALLWRVGDASVGLSMVPAGIYDESYIHRLADFDVKKYYRRGPNAIRELINDLKSSPLEPEVLLIDARTGFDPTGAVALLDLADLGVICFAPSEQSYRGLSWVVRAARLRQQATGRPDLRFVLSPVPQVAREKRDEWLQRADADIAALWGVQSDLSVEEIRHAVDYTSAVPLSENILALEEKARLSYREIADWIDASLPDPGPRIHLGGRRDILDQLRFEFPRSKDLRSEELGARFLTAEDFSAVLDRQTLVLVMSPGSGKTFVYRLLTERPEEVQTLLPSDNLVFLGASGGIDHKSWNAVCDSMETPGRWQAQALWLIVERAQELALPREMVSNIRRLGAEPLSAETSEVSVPLPWIRAAGARPVPELEEAIALVNRHIQARSQRVYLLYDRLDDLRSPLLEDLLSFGVRLNETRGARGEGLRAKCFLRPSSFLRLPPALRARQHSFSLHWRAIDVWRLVLHQAAESSPLFRQTIPSWLHDELRVSRMTTSREEANQAVKHALRLLWGERMGPSIRGFTHSWLWRRTADGSGGHYPRSVLSLLKAAVCWERENPSAVTGQILSPESLRHAWPVASQERVALLEEEEPALKEALLLLRQSVTPLTRAELAARGLDEHTTTLLAASGVLREEATGYAIAELYLPGLGGRRKHQRSQGRDDA